MPDAGGTVDLRPATVRDLDRIMALERLCFPEHARITPRDVVHALTRAGAHLLHDPRPDHEEAPRAFAGALWERLRGTPRAHLYTIDVRPDVRGRGLGSHLLEELERRARAWGAARVVLEVAVDNDPAIHLYERHGYARERRLEGYYQEARGEGDAWRYVKPLGEGDTAP